MKNRKGFGKFEVLTLIVVLMVISSFLCYVILCGAAKQRIETMKKSANSFLNAATVNADSFSSFDVVYLGEVVNEGFLNSIKSPFSKGNCSLSESKVYLGGSPTVTLKCDGYLIEKASFNGSKDVKVYKISNWLNKSTSKNQEKTKLYNCLLNGKEKYEEYYEPLYFVYRINQDYGKEYTSVEEIHEDCVIKEKTFYRTKEIQK